jgi:hypothetical protein
MRRRADTHWMGIGVSESQQLGGGPNRSRAFTCGVAVAGTHATWPLVRITVGNNGVMIAPRWRWLGVIFPPVYEFAWTDLQQVDVLLTFGRARGLRFVLGTPARVSRPYGALFAVWPGPVRRIRVGLHPDALDAVRAAIPPAISQQPRRSFGP